jgi:hypothetical protein
MSELEMCDWFSLKFDGSVIAEQAIMVRMVFSEPITVAARSEA